MAYLIDTHVCLWALADKGKLSARAREIIENNNQEIFVSQLSFFEIAIKLKIGKLPEFNTSLSEFIESVYTTGFEILPLKNEHLAAYASFDFVKDHRDPFDRYIIASGHFEKMAIISKDEKFHLYKSMIEVVW